MSPVPSASARPRATIRDVAELAGVGIKTVSRVVNDEAVSEATRARVEQAIVALDFQPNLGAGTLRRSDRKTLSIGLLLDAIDNPFFAAVHRAVEKVALSRSTAVFAASSEADPERERSLVRAFTTRRVDALILAPITADQSYLQPERDRGTAIAFVDRAPAGLAADAVVSDNVGASRAAVAHLVARGHRRIAHLGDSLSIATARERRRGFQSALVEAGLEPWGQARDVRGEEAARQAVHDLLRGPRSPTALYTSQNRVTVGAVRALHDLGRQHEVALIGLDDVPLADVLDPPITVLAQDPARLGTMAAERVFARLDGDPAPEATAVVPTRLIIRGSGEIPPPEH